MDNQHRVNRRRRNLPAELGMEIVDCLPVENAVHFLANVPNRLIINRCAPRVRRMLEKIGQITAYARTLPAANSTGNILLTNGHQYTPEMDIFLRYGTAHCGGLWIWPGTGDGFVRYPANFFNDLIKHCYETKVPTKGVRDLCIYFPSGNPAPWPTLVKPRAGEMNMEEVCNTGKRAVYTLRNKHNPGIAFRLWIDFGGEAECYKRTSSLPPAGRHRQSTNGGGGGSSPHINVQIQSPSVQLREEQPSNVGGSRIGIDATTARLGGLHLNREQLSSQLERRYAASRSGASMPTTSGQHTGDINWNRIMLDMFQDPEGMESSRNMWWGSILEHGPNFEPNRGLVQFPDERNARTVERLTDWRGNPLSLPNYRRANQMRPFIRGSPPPRYRSQTGLTVDDSASVAITEPSEQRSLFGRFREALRRRRNRMGQGLQQCIGCAAPGRDDDRDAYEPGAGYVSPTIKTRTNRSNIIVAEAKAYFGAA